MRESEAWLDDNWQRAMCTGAATTETVNLPYDRFGCVDWAKLDEWKLRSYSTDALKAELERRGEA